MSPEFEAPQHPGVYRIAVEVDEVRRDVEDLRMITLVPFAAKKKGQIGSYRLGQWPYERGGAPSSAYANPAGFVEVTRENRSLPVSEHLSPGLRSAPKPATRPWWAASASTPPAEATAPSPTWTRGGGGPAGGQPGADDLA